MRSTIHLTVVVGLAGLLATGCGGDDSEASADRGVTGSGGSGGSATGGSGGTAIGGAAGANSGDLDLSVCDPDSGEFTTTIDNPYLPFPVGRVWVYQGEEDDAVIDLRITVLDETEEVEGVTTRVVEEYEEEDGELVEISRNFFAQAADGTVCYFGEDVDIYEAGDVVSHEGAWRAGGDNQAGILMPADPEVGMTYQQELAPDVALDRAEIVSLGASWTVPAGSYDDVLETLESSPLDQGAVSHKVYAPGVGQIVDDPVELISLSE